MNCVSLLNVATRCHATSDIDVKRV